MDEPHVNDAPETSTFNRDRLLELVDGLERDLALVEDAMEAMESGNHESVDAALSVLGARPVE